MLRDFVQYKIVFGPGKLLGFRETVPWWDIAIILHLFMYIPIYISLIPLYRNKVLHVWCSWDMRYSVSVLCLKSCQPFYLIPTTSPLALGTWGTWNAWSNYLKFMTDFSIIKIYHHYFTAQIWKWFAKDVSYLTCIWKYINDIDKQKVVINRRKGCKKEAFLQCNLKPFLRLMGMIFLPFRG